MIHARIQEFSSGVCVCVCVWGGGGGGGVSRSIWHIIKKKLWQRFLFYFYFFKSLTYFTDAQWFVSKKTIICQGSSGGGTFSKGGSNFIQGGGGSNCFFPIETHITCDFQGVRTPAPLWSRPCDSAHCGLIYLLVFLFAFSI